jgi:SOS response regulatory protein OraA/RecX
MSVESVVTGDFILKLKKKEDFQKYREEIFFYLKTKKELYRKIKKPMPVCLAKYNDVINYLKAKSWVSQDEFDRL